MSSVVNGGKPTYALPCCCPKNSHIRPLFHGLVIGISRRHQSICHQFVDRGALNHGYRFFLRDGRNFRGIISGPIDDRWVWSTNAYGCWYSDNHAGSNRVDWFCRQAILYMAGLIRRWRFHVERWQS